MANACPACGKKYNLPAGAVGRAFVCKRCGLKLQITEHGLAIPTVPDAGPPVPPPQPVRHGPPPEIDVEPVAPVARTAYPGADDYPYARPAPAPPSARERFGGFDDDEDEPPRPRRRPPGGNVVLDFLLLRRHIAPTLIVVCFWVGTGLLVLSGLSTVVGSFNASQGVSFGGLDLGGLNPDDPAGGGGFKLPTVSEKRGFSFPLFLFGVVQLFVGPIVLRVACEFVILVFRINETLTDVKVQLSRDRP